MVLRFTLISTGLVGTEITLLTRSKKLKANSVLALLDKTIKDRLSSTNLVYDVTRLMGPLGPHYWHSTFTAFDPTGGHPPTVVPEAVVVLPS